MDNIFFGLLILVGVAAIYFVVSLLIRWRQWSRGHSNPLGLFISLCRAHKLTWSETWLLWRVARCHNLSDPACLFLEAERFETASLSAALRAQGQELKKLRERLFAQPKQSLDIGNEEQASSLEAKSTGGAPRQGIKVAPELDLSTWPTTTPMPPSTP